MSTDSQLPTRVHYPFGCRVDMGTHSFKLDDANEPANMIKVEM